MASPDRKSFPLRVDPQLFKEIEGWAHQEFRSVNGQIEFLLREAIRRRKGSSSIQSTETDKDSDTA